MNNDIYAQFLRSSQPVEGYEHGMTVMGIDPSPNNTGIAILSMGRIKFFTIGWGTEVNQVERLALFSEEIDGILSRYEPKAIAIEGYSFASKFSQSHKLGELGGTIKLAIRRYSKQTNAPLIITPPTTLKQFVRGIGKGSKADMLKDAKARWEFKTSQNDEIDAGALAFVAATVQYRADQKFGHVLFHDGKGKGGVEVFKW
ncbi:crossover junction endodeoxyribonuclease RuvC protein [Rhizobium phage vB_RleS_L338C]|uniref:crossover junction endodeoxyribonuclease RuvC protein n=1 Tax=Rhizobium phage vB_RleS_L338C TaxID=1414737 RepID=UPI0003D7B78B|nr:crossover junction endodeoxyribonuclease RuvC protein [Rhizobium phage vB_RleS_L338C]AHC30490.1 crossover junction endodeoxyribonuclease RuvC protein [Rhizobium phage vB_RleS_L338C]QNH72078.1 crossover junction endodeoxyribonuclease [Rhizobium phage P11VFA]